LNWKIKRTLHHWARFVKGIGLSFYMTINNFGADLRGAQGFTNAP
jgi:hypothetical protein